MKKNRVEKYIAFEDIPNPGKPTRKWRVVNRRTLEVIGLVKWYGGWRKYVYETEGAFYDADCLQLIGQFLADKTFGHMAGKRALKKMGVKHEMFSDGGEIEMVVQDVPQIHGNAHQSPV